MDIARGCRTCPRHASDHLCMYVYYIYVCVCMLESEAQLLHHQQQKGGKIETTGSQCAYETIW